MARIWRKLREQTPKQARTRSGFARSNLILLPKILSQMLTCRLSSAQNLFCTLSSLFFCQHTSILDLSLTCLRGTTDTIKSMHCGTGPAWPRAVYHIRIITAAVGSQQTTQRRMWEQNNMVEALSPQPLTSRWEEDQYTIQLVWFTTARRREIIYAESRTVILVFFFFQSVLFVLCRKYL